MARANVGIAVWTDKGDMLRYNDYVHFPCFMYSNSSAALNVLDKMDKASVSDSIVSIAASWPPPNTYSPAEEVSDCDFTITLRN